MQIVIKRYATHVVFWSALLLSLLSLGLVVGLGAELVVVLVVSAAFNVWSITKSERDGFVPTREMRRAHEPIHHFHPVQVLIIVVVLMVQVGVSLYVLLTV